VHQSFFNIISLSGVRLSPFGTAATTGLLYQPQIIDDADCGAIDEIKIGAGNRSTRRKPAQAQLCPPQIPYDLGSNSGRRGGKTATNRLSYGAAVYQSYNIYKLNGYVSPESRPPLWSSDQSSWLQIQRSRLRFPALLDFLRSSGSGTGSTQPRDYNWGATWMEKYRLRV
jgi:hypothetical protein